VKKKSAKIPVPTNEPLEDQYRRLFQPRISPLWVDEEDSNFSLEQPSPYKVVPSVTTYGVSEAPILR
jgi:hypothetical protein